MASGVVDEGFFLTFLNAILGPWGRAVLAWLVDHQMKLAAVASVWLGALIYGTYQMHEARRLAERVWGMTRHGDHHRLPRRMGLVDSQEAYERWRRAASQRTWIVPTRSGLWVERVTVDELARRLGFSVRDSYIGPTKHLSASSLAGSPGDACDSDRE